uniref:Uncharacterized protein n=1 Tax=Anguilla anguilla TaxID=7936 RepID=A0A0E9PB98_ANGAN
MWRAERVVFLQCEIRSNPRISLICFSGRPKNTQRMSGYSMAAFFC